MTVQASLEVIQLLEKLFKSWTEWDHNRSYYIHTLLPELQADQDRGTNEEKLTLRELKYVATPEEWDQLEAIAEELSVQKKRIWEISQALDRFFDQNDFAGAEAFISTIDGSSVLRLYETKKRNAIDGRLRAATTALEKFEFEKAKFLVTKILPYLSDAQIAKYQTFEDEQRQKFEEEKQRQAKEERVRFIATTIREIQELLKKYDFPGAEKKYALVKDDYPKDTYLQLVETYRKRQERENLVKSVEDKLKINNYIAADGLFRNSDLITAEEYLKIKSFYIQKFVQNRYSKSINSEQANAIASLRQNLLIKARAGSGKTLTLACKAGLLIDVYKVNPDQILILAFNNKAAAEIRNRIQRDLGIESFENARTFHSLAYQLVQPPKEELLFDQKGEFSRQKLSQFVQGILRAIWNPAFQNKLYEVFKREMQTIDNSGALLSDTDYYVYIRNQRDITLGGDRVKSDGEKFIADFLFEHDIIYSYERVRFWQVTGTRHNYRPDFVLFNKGKDYVIEFWGIDENDSQKWVPSDWSITWEDYLFQMQEKRKYWAREGIPLIEMSVVDKRQGRVGFEQSLKKRLEESGLSCKKLPLMEIEKKVVRIQKDRMTELFVQFIQKAKKRMLSAEDLSRIILEHTPLSDREKIFLDLAVRVYQEYEEKLANEGKIDFDELIKEASRLIFDTRGNCGISLGSRKDRRVNLNDLQWILIDEFQDFSLLFFNLIDKIKTFNPRLQILCVGDDWQAINSFAGSELRFFHGFQNLMPDAGESHIQTNYRNRQEIVHFGNNLMFGNGEPAKPLKGKTGGFISIRIIDDIKIERRDDPKYVETRKEDDRFIFYERRKNEWKMNDNGFLQARYLKACYQILTEPENFQTIVQTKPSHKDEISVAILSRTNNLYRISLEEFRDKLKSCFSKEELKQIGNFHTKIRIGTVHSFKGLEAKIVIILRTVEGAFPLIHTDNSLFRIFGQTEKDLLDEERRLFYVAITRASEKLYILTEEGRRSPFLPNSQGNFKSNGIILTGLDQIYGESGDIPF